MFLYVEPVQVHVVQHRRKIQKPLQRRRHVDFTPHVVAMETPLRPLTEHVANSNMAAQLFERCDLHRHNSWERQKRLAPR